MSVIVRTITRWVAAFIFVYGVYVVAYGHLSPGGGFAGGVILACAFILLVLALGRKSAFETFPYAASKSLDSAGALLFLVLAVGGLLTTSGYFFLNFIQKTRPGAQLRLFSAGIIPLANVAIALKVCASLFLVMVVVSALRVKAHGGDEDFKSLEE